MAIAVGLLFFFACSSNTERRIKTLEYPPFTIQKRTIKDKHYNVNTASSSSLTYNKYKVLYKGKPVVLPQALNQNSGISGLWRVYFLEDAPEPALLVGSQSIYLITEENEVAKVTPLYEQNSGHATLQWMDSEEGQPGEKTELMVGETADTAHAYTGGRYLLVQERTVLDVANLKVYPFSTNLDDVDGFYANDVVAFSPDQREIVFMGDRGVRSEDKEYALLSYNFLKNDVYTIPFTRNETRLHEPYQVPSNWVDTFFEWQESDEGSYFLKKKAFEQLPHWEGVYTKGGGYSLSSVKEELTPILFEFAKKYLELEGSEAGLNKYGGMKEYVLKPGDLKLNISFLENINSVYFSKDLLAKDSKEYDQLITKVANAFNEELRQGKYQEYFLGY